MSDTALQWLFGTWLFESLGDGARDRVSPRRMDGHASDSASGNRLADSHEMQWIAGLRAGNLDAFRAIFDTYAPRLHTFARFWVAPDVAEDIVQDVLFEIWRRRDTLDNLHTSLIAYCYAAVRNRALQYRRHQHVVRRTETEQPSDVPHGMGMGPAAPDAQLLVNDFRDAFAAAIAPLSELQRTVLMLRWAQGLSFAQIATALSISENAAKLHASRGRKQLVPLLRTLIPDLE